MHYRKIVGDNMRDSLICPYCGGFMDYIYSDDCFICDTCCYMIRGDGTEDFSEMDMDEDKIKI